MNPHTANQHRDSRRQVPSGTTAARPDNSHVVTTKTPETEKRPARRCQVGQSLGTKLSSLRCRGQYGCKGLALVVMSLQADGCKRKRKTEGRSLGRSSKQENEGEIHRPPIRNRSLWSSCPMRRQIFCRPGNRAVAGGLAQARRVGDGCPCMGPVLGVVGGEGGRKGLARASRASCLAVES